jgi:hypothetical protein
VSDVRLRFILRSIANNTYISKADREYLATLAHSAAEREAAHREEIEWLSISREADMERAWNEGHRAGQSYATVVDYDDTTDYSVNPYAALPDTAVTIAPDALPNDWVHIGQSRRCTQHGVTECDLHPAGDQ